MNKILIGADLVPTESNYSLFKKRDVDQLLGKDLYDLLQSADFSIFNLEVPLVDNKTPIEKCGPNLIAPTYTIDCIKDINPHFFTLANNHILDQGYEGLSSTTELLDKYGIAHAGTGENLNKAKEPYIYHGNGINVGIYCCAQHEFSIADDDMPGANPFDPFESLDEISSLKTKCDYVIVLYHGGKEHYRYPSPYLQKVCRKIVDKGADLVVCQHSHCIGCEENWNSGTIIYGQGNFLFDISESDYWQTGLLLELNFDENNNPEPIIYHPLKKNGNQVRLAQGNVKESIMSDFNLRSQQILGKDFVRNKYLELSRSSYMNFLSSFAGNLTSNIIFRVINKLSCHSFERFLLRNLYTRKNKLGLLNYIECEAHSELIIKGLKNK